MADRCAILDDYQNVALSYADWSKVAGDVEVKVFNEPLGGPDKVIAALKDCTVVCLMRERTAFLRNTIEALPDLKLLITTGAANKSIDLAAAAERGITVAGTGSFGNPTTGIAFGLILELTRRIGFENARLQGRRALAVDGRPRPRRQDARRPRARQARHAGGGDRQGVRHEGDRLEPEPHRRERPGGGGVDLRQQGGSAPPGRLRDHPRPVCAARTGPRSAPPNSR